MTNKKTKSIVAGLASIATFILGFVLLAPFQKDFPSVSLFGSCSADVISGANKIETRWITQTGTELVVQGWAADIEKKTAASEVSVQLIDDVNNVIQTWNKEYDTDRPDVVTAFNNPSMVRSGFNLNIGSIPLPGVYKIQLGSVNEGQYQLCTVPTIIEVNAYKG